MENQPQSIGEKTSNVVKLPESVRPPARVMQKISVGSSRQIGDLSNVLEFSKRADVHASARPSEDEWYRAMGARLRAFRIQRGVSEKDAAAAAEVSKSTWLRYERNGRPRSVFPIVRFCDRYSISLDDIIRD